MNFPKGFFQEETKWDFTISEMMKRAWAAELEVFEVIDTICRKHNIKYFACGGTLIGAIRHQGFIPWDDDMDLTMLREDYNRFIEVLPDELPDGFVISGMYANCERLQSANLSTQLRIIADEEYFSFPMYLNRFHGFPYFRIGIDIFPLDYVSKDHQLFDFQRQVMHAIHFTIQNWDLYIKEGQLESQIQEIERACDVSLDKNANMKTQLLLLWDQVAQLANPDACDEVTNFHYSAESTNWPFHDRPKVWYESSVYKPYEVTTMPVPAPYEEVLTGCFGDWKTPIKFTGDHEYPFYKNQETELRRMFDHDGLTVSIEEFCRNWQHANGAE